MSWKSAVLTAVLGAVAASFACPVSAEPILQLYLEGATYDAESESWVLEPGGSSGGGPFRLWAIGNVSGPGGKGTISDVRLSVAYDESYTNLQITLTPSRAGGALVGKYLDLTDQFEPATTPETTFQRNGFIQTSAGEPWWDDGPVVTDGSAPVLFGGAPLPSHGEFGEGIWWTEFWLGNFDNPDDALIGDFIYTFPTELHYGGQINVYEVTVTGGSGAVLHFDLYNHVAGRNRGVFAPFSHDAHIIPAPSSLVALVSMAVVGLGGWFWRRRRSA